MIPRCDHDRIILGCPDPNCEKQNAYLADQDAAFVRWGERMMQEAREIIDLLIAEERISTPTPGAE